MGPSLSCLALLSFVLFQKKRGGTGQENIFWIHFIKRMKETLLTKFKSNSGKLRAGGSPTPTLLAWQVSREVGEESGRSGQDMGSRVRPRSQRSNQQRRERGRGPGGEETALGSFWVPPKAQEGWYEESGCPRGGNANSPHHCPPQTGSRCP